MSTLIVNGRVIDPSQDIDGFQDILIEEGKIRELYAKGKGPKTKSVVDASGCIVIPGLVDMHTHLREPGFEYKETIATGTLAALKGGFTSVCCMPNTNPVNDNKSVTEFIIDKALRQGACSVYPIGAITQRQEGEQMTEFGTLINSGCVAFSDDGMPVTDSLVMRRVLEYSKIFDVPVISHCEDLQLSAGGVVNEGIVSTTLGLKGIPNAAEEIMVSRDIALSELTGGRLHIAHISTAGSVELVRNAKSRGINVTAETCPHYFTLTDDALKSYDTNLKVNPPIRSERDVEAVKQGLKDGTIDVIATDHAPHHADDKNKDFDLSAFGISGLETAFALGLRLVDQGVLDLKQFINKMSTTPSKLMRIPKGSLMPNADADIAVINLEKKITVDSSGFMSKGKNTPFDGWLLKGAVEKTVSRGKIHKWE